MNKGIFWQLRVRYLRFFARRIVTPFTPFVLSHAWLSSEVQKYKLQGLNPRSIDLSKRIALPNKPNTIIYVQVDQLEFFREQVLDKITAPFTLVTGKWHLPALTIDNVASEILANPFLTAWYSQNTPSPSKILAFPYGVNLNSAPLIWSAAHLRSVLGFARKGVFVPYVRIHSHLKGAVRENRLRIREIAGNPHMGLARYLLAILRHKYVISPPGDRSDTYRHWESIALGAMPISDLGPHWTALFGEHMVLVDDLVEALTHTPPETAFRPAVSLASVSHWRKIVLEGEGVLREDISRGSNGESED